jgi:hypothetical protein
MIDTEDSFAGNKTEQNRIGQSRTGFTVRCGEQIELWKENKEGIKLTPLE